METRHRMRFSTAVAGMATIAVLGACATSEEPQPQRTAEGGIAPVEVVVQNDLQPPTPITVWIDEEGGTRHILGTVPPTTERTLTFDGVRAFGTYALVARTDAGQEVVSDSFVLSGGETVTWDMSSNAVTR